MRARRARLRAPLFPMPSFNDKLKATRTSHLGNKHPRELLVRIAITQSPEYGAELDFSAPVDDRYFAPRSCTRRVTARAINASVDEGKIRRTGRGTPSVPVLVSKVAIVHRAAASQSLRERLLCRRRRRPTANASFRTRARQLAGERRAGLSVARRRSTSAAPTGLCRRRAPGPATN
jgi:hypothetical protein